jgi:hypothetical protein
MKAMKKQALVNMYRKGQARPEDRRHLDDDSDRKAFDAWWKSSAHRYNDDHPSVYDAFEAFYNGDDKDSRTPDEKECKKGSMHKNMITLPNKSNKSQQNITTVPAHLFPST